MTLHNYTRHIVSPFIATLCLGGLFSSGGCTTDHGLQKTPEHASGVAIAIRTTQASLRAGEADPNNGLEDNITALLIKGAGGADNTWAFDNPSPGELTVRVNPGDVTMTPGSEQDLYFVANVFGGSLGASMKETILTSQLSNIPSITLQTEPFAPIAYVGSSADLMAKQPFLMTAKLPNVSKKKNISTNVMELLSNGSTVSGVALQRVWNKVIVKLKAKPGNTNSYALRRVELLNVPATFGLITDIADYPTALQATNPYLPTDQYTSNLNSTLAVSTVNNTVNKAGVIANNLSETQERIFVCYLPPYKPQAIAEPIKLRLYFCRVDYISGNFKPQIPDVLTPYDITISSDKMANGTPGRNVGRNNRITYTLTVSGWSPATIGLTYSVQPWDVKQIDLPSFN